MNRLRITTGTVAAIAACLALGLAGAQGCENKGGGQGKTAAHGEGEEGHGAHGEARPSRQPQSYAEALEVIHEQLERIDELIKSRKLDQVHAEAAVIRDVAGTLGQLALKPDSGVPRQGVRDVNATAKELAAKFGPIDQAGDSSDAAGTRKVYDEMVALHEKLESHAPGKAPHGHGK